MSSPNIHDIKAISKNKGAAVIQKARPTRAIRNVLLALTLTLTGAVSMTHPSVAQAQAPLPTTTGMMVILTVKPGVAREQVMAIMPAEIRKTVQLYLNGKIREWYSRGDGRGVVLLLATSDVVEAQAIMDGLPLAKQNFGITSTSQSARSCRSACLWPIPERLHRDASHGGSLMNTDAGSAAIAVAAGTADGRKAAMLWNIFGLADFAVAITLGLIISSGPFQLSFPNGPNIGLDGLSQCADPRFRSAQLNPAARVVATPVAPP